MDGNKSVPPATIFTSPPCLASMATASSRLLGRRSWKLGRLTAHLRHARAVSQDRADAARALCRETRASLHARETSPAPLDRRMPSSQSSSCLSLHAALLGFAPE